MSNHVKITARLMGQLAGDAPKLDALLEATLARHHGKAVAGAKLDKGFPAPKQGEIPIPIARERLGPWLVGKCSDPIYGEVAAESADHYCRRIEAHHAPLLAPSARRKIATGNSWTKSYRLPLRTRLVDRVVWFAQGDRKRILSALKQCRQIGKKTAIGYGRVVEWTVERIDDDLTWYAPTDGGLVLMRTLPVGPWLPGDLIGARPDFGAAVTPYWHPERFTEIVTPC